MKKALLVSAICLSACGAATAQPTITSLSASSLPRSGRLLIQGSGFGAVQGTSRVEIGGFTAPVTRWSDILVAAYVPEAAPTGSAMVQIFAGGGASNTVPLTVMLRQPNGRVKWRFQADSDYILQRPALGPDGTIIAHDAGGFVYALQPDGGLKWIFKTPAFAYGPPSIGADGTIYVASIGTIYALNPDGTLKWSFTEPPGGQGVIAGPSVGSDGNIYAVTDFGGLGALALSPDGQLLWNRPGFSEYGQIGREIVFGAPSQLYVQFDMAGTGTPGSLFGLGLDGGLRFTATTRQSDQVQPAVGPNGTVYTITFPIGAGLRLGAFNSQGNLLWTFFQSPTNVLTNPDVGPDDVIYIGQNLIHLYAINPNGTQRWAYTDVGMLFDPIVSPLNPLVFMGGQYDYGQPGFFLAVDTAGSALWRIDLPFENGANIIPFSRARFASDGQTAYIGTALPGEPAANEYSYLYAIDTSGSTPPPVILSSLTLNPTSVVGGDSSQGTVTLSGAAPTGGAVVSLTSDNTAVATVPANVTVPAGATSATFTVTTSAVTTTTSVTISAAYNGVTETATLTVQPRPVLTSLTVKPTTVVGSKNATGKVVLDRPAPSGGAVVTLSNTNPAANCPASVTVPAGAASQTFTITTAAVNAITTGTVTATYGGASKSAALKVRPIGVAKVTLSPNPVGGGNDVTGTVTLEASAAPGDIVVNLSSTNAAVASPTVTSITIPAGSRTGTFTVGTADVTVVRYATIRAKANGIGKSKRLTVNP